MIAANGKAFCAGHDLKQMRVNNSEAYYTGAVFQNGRADDQHHVSAATGYRRVQGIATAAGCQLVASCDMAVAVDSARFAVSGINVGLSAVHRASHWRAMSAESVRWRCC